MPAKYLGHVKERIQLLSSDELVGIKEIADMAGVTPSTVSNWRARFPDFPRPVRILAMGPIFHSEEIMEWLASDWWSFRAVR